MTQKGKCCKPQKKWNPPKNWMAYRSMCPILWGPTGAVESFNVLPMENHQPAKWYFCVVYQRLTILPQLVGGLEHELYFSIYWE